ncbi:hypothetical protein KFL_007120100 [Klebsormidium nitens]|uniref:Ubiquitin-like protease family profile domain-containing protein n=1 Tax=Klebsormidium nitens TaxID=105231 RepID=A0A1Y1IQI1_KLENI|nr:hypothetical protein KFL_007120100 [Klebsormidium nitens]|eukprot:GAQ91006.1 hypothetical protein KFL_007120100 [Klebsormidium nitens]
MYAFKRAPGTKSRARLRTRGTADPQRPLPFTLSGFNNRVYEQAQTLVETRDELHDIGAHVTVGAAPDQVTVLRGDLHTLHKDENISDGIVDGMCKLISDRGDCSAYPSTVYTMATHGQLGPLLNVNNEHVWRLNNSPRTMATKLAPYLFQNIAEAFNARRAPQGMRYAFMPINVANYHWTLVVYDAHNARLIGYDPLMNSMPDELSNVERILRDANVIQGPVQHVNGTDVPGQTDSTSCGPAIITYMIALMREALRLPPLYAHTVRTIRKYVACALLASSLGPAAGRNAVAAPAPRGRASPPRFQTWLHLEINIPELLLSKDEKSTRMPDVRDVASLAHPSGMWILGVVPGVARPMNYNTLEPLADDDALTFAAGDQRVAKSFRSWAAGILYDAGRPQPNIADFENLANLGTRRALEGSRALAAIVRSGFTEVHSVIRGAL